MGDHVPEIQKHCLSSGKGQATVWTGFSGKRGSTLQVIQTCHLLKMHFCGVLPTKMFYIQYIYIYMHMHVCIYVCMCVHIYTVHIYKNVLRGTSVYHKIYLHIAQCIYLY